jgi:hypothetical protein
MGLAKMDLEVDEQNLGSSETYRGSRLSSLGIFLEDLWQVRDAMRNGRPLGDAPRPLEQLRNSSHFTFRRRNEILPPKSEAHSLMSTENGAMKVGVFGNFRIEGSSLRATSRLLGWRITATDQTTGLQHDFYIREGRIYHVQFHSSPPWNHSTEFTVGGREKRIMDSEQRAILQAVADWS